MPLEDAKWALAEFGSDGHKTYTIARNYYDGNHTLSFATEKFRGAFGYLFSAFADNLCCTVVESLRDRLKLEGFKVGDDEEEKTTQEIWRQQRMRHRSGQVHLDALIEGDAYLIVWPDRDTGAPAFYPNRAGNVVIDYDDEKPGYIVRAAKRWTDSDGYGRLTLYYRDNIEKYITRNKLQGGMSLDEKSYQLADIPGEPNPLLNPYDKVPVFHFANRASIGMGGISELREAIPVQDALNKSVMDMLVAQEFYALPQRWATGMVAEIDPATNQPLSLDALRARYNLVAGGVWATTSAETKFGEFSAGNLEQFLKVSETFRKEMARVSRTPLHFFNLEGNFPSGEALRTAEAPLQAKVEDRQESWGAVWADAMRFALTIAGRPGLEPEPLWANTEPRNDAVDIANAEGKQRLGVDGRTLLRELGYTDKEIDEMLKRKDEEKREAMKMMEGAPQAPAFAIQGTARNGQF